MPSVTETPQKAYAHCRDARCPGYNQEEIDAVHEETFFTFGDGGGDGVFASMTERSMVEFKAVNAEDVPCPACGVAREVTGQARPSYRNESGHDPMGLIGGPKFNAAVKHTEADAQTAALQAQVTKLAAQIEKLTASGDDA
jgi:hypothetical protein